MKKLLTILSALTLASTVPATVVACGGGSVNTQHDDAKNVISIKTIENDLNILLNSKNNSSWKLEELQNEVEKKWPNGGIEVKKEDSDNSSNTFSWLGKPETEKFTFIGKGTIDNDFKYNESIELTHNWIQREDTTLPIKTIKNELNDILNDEQHKTKIWSVKELQNKIDDKFGVGEIEAKLISDEKDENIYIQGEEKRITTFEFIGKGTIDNEFKYNESIQLKIKWTLTGDISTPIEKIETELNDILNDDQHKTKNWDLKELQSKINETWSDGGIEVKKEDSNNSSNTFSWLDEPKTEKFTFIGKGTIDNEFKYKGHITLTHEWTERISTTEPVKKIETELNGILNDDQHKTKNWDLKELQSKINETWSDGGIEVKKEDSNNSSNTFSWLDEPKTEKFTFIGKGTIDNEFKYEGQITLTHEWTERKDTTTSILNIKNDLEDILKRKNDQAWDIEDLQNAITAKWINGGIKVERVIDEKPFSSGIAKHEESFVFKAEGTIDNKLEYSGQTEPLIHIWTTEGDTTEPLTNVKEIIESFVKTNNKFNSYEGKEEKLIQNVNEKIKEKYPNIKDTGIKKVKIEKIDSDTSERSSTPININEKLTFIADGNVANDGAYTGECMVIHTYQGKKDTTTDIHKIEGELNDFINDQKHNSDFWEMEDKEGNIGMDLGLKSLIKNKFGTSTTIERISQTKPSDDIGIQNIEETFKIIANGNINNNDKYTGEIQIVHKIKIMNDGYPDLAKNITVYIDNDDKERQEEKFDFESINAKEILRFGVDDQGGTIKNFHGTKVPSILNPKITKLDSMFSKNDNSEIDGLSTWDTKNIKSLNALFRGSKFNGNIAEWNTFNVENMNYVFMDADKFNQNIVNWKTDNVNEMSHMFTGAKSFNQSLNNWHVGNITKMNSLFSGAESFNQDLSKWDTRNVIDMGSMFQDTKAFNKSLNEWNTSNVADMQWMFKNSNFNQDISGWDVSKVKNMSGMFQESNFNQDISSWKTNSLNNMSQMFFSSEFNKNISGWDTSKVTNIEETFAGEGAQFNGDISGWDTSKVTNMHNLFNLNNNFNQNISDWNVSNATDMSGMFEGAGNFNQNLTKWNTSKVKNMANMFKDAKEFNGDLSEWDTSKVKDMAFMFNSAEKFDQDISNFNVSIVTDMQHMFDNAKSFTGKGLEKTKEGTNDKGEPIEVSVWDTASVLNMNSMFKDSNMTADIHLWSVAKVNKNNHLSFDDNTPKTWKKEMKPQFSKTN